MQNIDDSTYIIPQFLYWERRLTDEEKADLGNGRLFELGERATIFFPAPDNQGVTHDSESWEGTIDYMPPMLGRLITEEEIEFLRKPRDYPFPPN